MALAITGQTGQYAISGGLVRSPASVASGAGDGNEFPCYHFINDDGTRMTMRQCSAGDGPGSSVLEFVNGGQQGHSVMRLTQQNAIDLVAAVVTFANTGVLS